MKRIQFILTIALMFVTTLSLARETVGWVEKAIISEQNVKITARIDSGAKDSSLHCDCVNKYMKNDQPWLDISVSNSKGKPVILSRKIIRSVKIKRHDGKFQIRDVIRMKICLGSVAKEVEVNLVDRSGLNYQLLIGRSFLKGDFLIDTGKTFINPPNCS